MSISLALPSIRDPIGRKLKLSRFSKKKKMSIFIGVYITDRKSSLADITTDIFFKQRITGSERDLLISRSSESDDGTGRETKVIFPDAFFFPL